LNFPSAAHRDFFFLFRGCGPVRTSLQTPIICFTPAVIMAVAWRLISAVTLPRAAPATALAPLKYMLSRGFLLVQGDFISPPRFPWMLAGKK
jgi:hypothetical protein